MNLVLLSKDAELEQEFQNKGYFNVVVKNNISDLVDFDVLVISDKEVNYNDLIIALDLDNNNLLRDKYLFYVLTNQYNNQIKHNIETSSLIRNIEIIQPNSSNSYIVDKVIEKVIPKEISNNVVVFFGADTKVGTTMVAQSTAELLAENTDAKIGLIHLNCNTQNQYIKSKKKVGLDDIKIKLINDILTPDELFDLTRQEDINLNILSGIENFLNFRQYHPEHIDRLLKLASEKFSLVIIDAGNNIDSGLAISALNYTNNRYLVTTQQEASRKNFQLVQRYALQQLGFEENSFLLIVNKYIRTSNIYNATQLAEIYKMTLATYIPNLDLLGWQAEFDQKTLLQYSDMGFNRQIELLGRLISSQQKIPFNSDLNKKTNFWKKAFNNLGGLM